MAQRNGLCSMLFLTGTLVVLFGSVSWAAEGIISKVPDSSGIYCNLKFPAIREDTLNSNRPQLKDPSEGDIVDFYGPCDYNPLGQAEVQRQRGDIQREMQRQFGDQ
jgi:hypothetical protein